MKSNFEERKQHRIDRYEELSEKAEERSQELWDEGRQMASAIPFGQPILVGHHSEQRDRNYRKKIDNKHRKAYEEGRKAEHYAQKAQAAAGNKAIFSDDPEAIRKLKEKIAQAERKQEHMKAANKICRAKKTSYDQKVEALQTLGYNIDQADTLLYTQYSYEKPGFQGWELSNNSANLRRMKQRLAELEKAETETTSEQEINGITIRDSVEDNRLQIFFPDRPGEDTRALLKRHGFRWSRTVGAWMRHRSDDAEFWGKQIVEQCKDFVE